MTAAAKAATRCLLSGVSPRSVAVRLPVGYYLPVDVACCAGHGDWAEAVVIKDGGDDPDVTHKARVCVRLWLAPPPTGRGTDPAAVGSDWIRLTAGVGVGRVTKSGLPVAAGEPAVNPVPRRMLAENLFEELERVPDLAVERTVAGGPGEGRPGKAAVWLPVPESAVKNPVASIHVEVSVPRGEELARHTLNPRLGVVGGISILGTTGLVKPFSHQAYEETIQVALDVARANGCAQVVFSTGGKSEKLARALLNGLPAESFVQIADFFSFAVKRAVGAGFRSIVHSVFFGKAVKMAQGNPYTHAHKVALDLNTVARWAAGEGVPHEALERIRGANTARHALEILKGFSGLEGAPFQDACQRNVSPAYRVVRRIAQEAVRQSKAMAGPEVAVRLLLFDFDGTLLADVTA
ncbi:cobalt-precorrin-5B (C1)-methyltransferase [Desulfacinum hydrothermale DSM 13146]|uniref:Cobalt-precorrin-5B C(1)-methyltransferase n=2 Tax=Desulfacinum hydrothermale TaxID=109258 RepID=A0A1W1WXI3_9BACT|nr:cobalt-precorrin-5B (C1)-methyltransferase [Desulfacinum hydrothermale DSM 13146]